MHLQVESAPILTYLSNDILNEPGERFRIALSLADPDADGGTTLMASREVTIIDDDPITATLGGGASIIEGSRGIATVTLSGGTATADVVVNYSFSGTGITAGDITGGLSGSITIDSGLTGEIPIAVADDGISDTGETLTVTATATSAGQVTVAGSPQTFNILEGVVRTLTVTGPDAIAEGAADVESGAYTVTLDGANFGAATAVTWAVAHGETADADFVAPADRSGTLNFGTGDTSMTFTLTVADDNLNETDEGFTVNVSVANPGADGGTFISVAHTTTISDAADDAIGVAIDRVGGGNVNEAATVDFSVTLSGGVRTSDLTVPFVFGDIPNVDLDNAEYAITAPAGLSAAATGGTLTFPADGSQTASDSMTIRVNLIGDTLNEDEEFLRLSGVSPLSTAGAVRYVGGSTEFVTVDDDDPIAATLSGGSRVAEGGTATVNVALGATTTSEVTLTYDIGGVGVSTADFSGIADLLDNTVSIPSGQSSASIALALAADDTLNEADKDFTVTVVPADFMGQFGDATVADGTQTFTIADNDPITVSIARASGAPSMIDEGDTATFTITLSVASAGEVTVPYTASGTTGTPTDPDSGSITFAVGATTRDIALTVPFGSAFGSGDAAETLTVTLGATARVAAPGGGAVTLSGTSRTATVTVNYIDAMHRVGFSSPTAMIAEGAAATTYVVSRTGPAISTGNSIVVRWSYAAGTSNPAAAADFVGGAVPAGGMLTFVGNETSKMFTVTTQADLLNEAGETFTLGLTAANMVLNSNGGVVLGDAVAVTITDDAADAIEVAIERVGGANVGEAAMANFSVMLSGGVRTADLIVPFAFSGLDNAEYAITMPTGIAADATGGTLTFLADSTQTATDRLTVTVNLMGDTRNEAAETLTIAGAPPGADGLRTAGAVRYADSGGDSATVTVDDDDPITVSVARHSSTSATIDEGATATFTFTLSPASDGEVTVPYTVTSSTTGYTPTDSDSGSVTIPARQTTRDITLMMPLSAMLGSSAPDGTVTVTLGTATVAPPGGGTVTSGSPATVMVNYIGESHALAFSNPTTSIVEGETATYTVTRTGPDIMIGGGRIVVSLAFHTAGSVNPISFLRDLRGGLPINLTFTGSERTQTFTIATAEDLESESDEDFFIVLSGVTSPEVTLPEALRVVIGENDRPVTLSVTAPVGALTEGTAADFAVSFPESVTTTAPVTVDWAISFPASALGVIPAAAADFAPSMMSGTASIGAGTSSVNVAITARADMLNEAEESFIVTLSAPAGGGVIAAPVLHATPSATATIAASDPITASITPATFTIDEGASTTLTMTLDQESAAAVTLSYTVAAAAVSPGTSVPMFTHSGGSGTSGSITIAAGQTTGTIMLASTPDPATDTGTGMLTVALGTISAGTGGGMASASVAAGSAVVTVNFRAFDRSFAVVVDNANTAEDDTATFTVTLTGTAPVSGMPATVTWTLSGVETSDYTSPSTGTDTLTFTNANWNTARTVSVAIARDNLNEGDETLTLTLSNPGGGGGAGTGIATASASTTIAANDPIIYGIRGADALTTVTEAVGATVTLTINLSRASEGDVTVPFRIDDISTATGGGADYTDPAMMTVTVAAGRTSASLDIALNDDRLNEADESLVIELGETPILGAGAGRVVRTSFSIGTIVLDLADSALTATIADNDPIGVAITPASPTANEGGTADFILTVTPMGTTLSDDLTVDWTASGVGISAADFVAASLTGTVAVARTAITAGNNNYAFSIAIANDGVLENAEDLSVALSSPDTAGAASVSGTAAGVTIAGSAASAHIVSVSGPAAAVDEGGNAVFTLRLPAVTGSNARTAALTVNYAVSGTAASGADYSAPSGNVTFPVSGAGATLQEVAIAITDDSDNEAAETLILTLTGVAAASPPHPGGTAASGVARAAIRASDAITVSVARTDTGNLQETSVAAGDNDAIFRITLSGGQLTGEAMIPLELITRLRAIGNFAGVAEDSFDFSVAPNAATLSRVGILGNYLLRIPASVSTGATTTVEITATAVDDRFSEVEETLILSLRNNVQSPLLGTIASLGAGGPIMLSGTESMRRAEATLAASDPVTVSIAAPMPATVNEGGAAVFPLRLNGFSSGVNSPAFIVAYSVTAFTQGNAPGNPNTGAFPDIAGGNADGSFSGTIEITAVGGAEIRIPIFRDGFTESDETFTVSLDSITSEPTGGLASVDATNNTASATIAASTAAARMLTVSGPDRIAEGTAGVESGAYTITLTGTPFPGATTVTWTVSPDSSAGANPIEDADFVAAADRTGTVNFTAGVTSRTFSITVAADSLNEATESFTVQASIADPAASVGTVIGAAAATTITDAADDAIVVAITAVAASAAEGATASFTATLTGGTRTENIIIPFTVSGLTDTDFTVMRTSVPSGASSARLQQFRFPGLSNTARTTDTIALNLLDNALNEADKTAVLTGAAAGPSGLRTAGAIRYASGGDTASVTVTDNDPIVVGIVGVSADADPFTPTVVDVNEGGTATFRIAFTGAAGGSATEVQVPYVISGVSTDDISIAGVGTLALDDNSVVIPALMTEATLAIQILHDGVAEFAAETLTVILVDTSRRPIEAAGAASLHGVNTAALVRIPPSAASSRDFAIAVDTGTSKTTDRNPALPGVQVNEGDTVYFRVTLTGTAPETGSAATVNWAVSGTGITLGDHNAPSSNRSLTFTNANYMMAQEIQFTVTDDSDNEAAETLVVMLSGAAGGGGGGTGIRTAADSVIIAASDPITITLSGGGNVAEGASATVTATVSGALRTAPVVVNYTIGADADNATVNAAAGDYTDTTGGSIRIGASDSSGNIVIGTVGDDLNEASEIFTVSVAAGGVRFVGGGPIVVSGSPQTFTIADDDAIAASIAPATLTIDEGASATLTMTLDHASAAAVTLSYTVAAAAGTGGTPMFTHSGGSGASGSLTIAEGQTTGTILLASTPDSAANTGDGTLTVTLGATPNVDAGGGMASASGMSVVTVNFREFERFLAVAVDDADTVEGDTATFTVTLTGTAPMSGMPATVTWALTGSAVPADYRFSTPGVSGTGGTLSFASLSSQTILIVIADDEQSEPQETLTFTLSNPGGGGGVGTGLGTASAELRIADNDAIRVSLTGPRTVSESATATYTVTLSAMPTAQVTMDWAVTGTLRGDDIEASAADFVEGLPTGMLTFAARETSRSIVIRTSAGAPGLDGSTDNTRDRVFTITLSNIMGGGGMIVAAQAPPASFVAFTVTIREDDPVARTMRMEQAATTLNRATAALSVPVFERRFDPGRGLSGPGLALNLGGKQVLSPPGGRAASAGAGADGYAAIGIPNQSSASRALAREGVVRGAASGAGTGNDGAGDASAAAVPATVAGAVMALAPGGAFPVKAGATGAAAAVPPPAAGEQGEQPSLLGLASLDVVVLDMGALDVGTLDMSALAELVAAQLEGLDSLSPGTESRSLQQLLGNSSFSATSDRGGGRTLSVWGRGSYTTLDGEPEEGGNRYDYEGDSYAFHLGLDGRSGDYLAGVAVGYTVGELELRTVSGPAAGAAGDRSDFESTLVAVYPYASWQPSERFSIWLLAGYGQGELEIEEHVGANTRKATSDTDLWLGAAGMSWRYPASSGLDMLLRLSGTALHGETDGGRFDDGLAYAETETDAQQLRGEGELGQVFGFGAGGRLRPYLRAGASYDFGDGSRDAATGEFGTGFKLHWPRLGLETELEIQARLTSKDDRDYREYTGTGTLRYDLGGDRRGLQLALRPAFGLTRGLSLDGLDTAVAPLDGGVFGAAPSALQGGGAGSGLGSGLGLHGELSYGIGNVRALRGLPGLLTLYGAGGLSSGAGGELYRGGVRFEAERLTLDAGLRHKSGSASDTGFLLDGNLRF